MAHDYSSEDCDWQSDGNRSSDCHQGHGEADPSRKLSFLERRSLMHWIERPLLLADMAGDVEHSRYVLGPAPCVWSVSFEGPARPHAVSEVDIVDESGV